MNQRSLRAATRYVANMMAMVARQQGYPAAAAAGSRVVLGEVAKLPRFARLAVAQRGRTRQTVRHPTRYSEDILRALAALEVDLMPCRIDVTAFRAHVAAAGYPSNYAGGPVDQGGAREKKL